MTLTGFIILLIVGITCISFSGLAGYCAWRIEKKKIDKRIRNKHDTSMRT